LEAELVTADGTVRTVNACSDPELFWALKGGGGGSFGVVTRLTLKTHELPAFFGIVHVAVSAKSDGAYRQLVERLVDLYADRLFNPHWGEQMVFRPNNTVEITMVFQGIDQRQADETWRPLFDWVTASKQAYQVTSPPMVVGVPARALWNPAVLKQVPGLVVTDDRADAPEGNIFWAGDAGQVGQVLYGYQSTWLPESLLHADRRAQFIDALFAASRHSSTALHFNKGLAGAPDEAVAAARETATNPAVGEAFALAIIAANAPPAYPGIAGHEPDKAAAQARAEATDRAMRELRKLIPHPGSYVSETNFHEKEWQRAFWGPNYPRLQAAKAKYDPDGLFFVHHGVGSEKWSSDGFTRLAT
jgi:FAD/FMN-containing dehydrogenase